MSSLPSFLSYPSALPKRFSFECPWQQPSRLCRHRLTKANLAPNITEYSTLQEQKPTMSPDRWASHLMGVDLHWIPSVMEGPKICLHWNKHKHILHMDLPFASTTYSDNTLFSIIVALTFLLAKAISQWRKYSNWLWTHNSMVLPHTPLFRSSWPERMVAAPSEGLIVSLTRR